MPLPSNPLNSDHAIYAEATDMPHDHGVHDASSAWWLSPDITSTGPNPPRVGEQRDVQMRVHNHGGLPGTTNIVCEAWTSALTTVPTPANGTLIGTFPKFLAQPVDDTGVQKTLSWTPGASGHHCIIGRYYPDTLTPSGVDFYQPQDPHCVQHNLNILPVVPKADPTHEGPAGPDANGFWNATVRAANVSADDAQAVSLRLEPDTAPSEHVQQAVLPWLRQYPGFKRISAKAPLRFRLDTSAFPGAAITDHSTPSRTFGLLQWLFEFIAWILGLFGKSFDPGGSHDRYYTADVTLPPGALVTSSLRADVSNLKPGDAAIIHMRQIGSDGISQGGLTVAFLMVG